MPETIRFAVLCSGKSLAGPTMRMISKLVERQDVLCVAVLDIGQEPPLPGGRAWSLYRTWSSAQPRFSIHERFPDLRKVECPLTWDVSRGVFAISAETLSCIAALNLDFCLQAAHFPLGGDLSSVARFGVWTMFYGNDGGEVPPVFGELERREQHVPISLQGLGAPRQILWQGVVNTVFRSYSQTLDNAVTAGIDFPALLARRILKTGALPVIGTHTSVAKPPSATRGWRFLLRQRLAWLKYQWSETIRSEMWNVGVVNAPIHTFLNGLYPSQIDWLPPLKNRRFLADPFAVAAAEGFQLLTEEFDYDRYQGYITRALYRPGLSLGENRVVIDEGVHMSYPFPLMYEGRMYCIPESQRRREVSIYRMQEDDGRWVQEGVLIRDFAAIDPTVIQYAGKWWLFCTCQDDLPECKLFIWHAADLFGPWEPHALHPVKCDVRCSRPGGTPFILDGQLYRPAQDSSTGYGSALSINRVLRLTEDEFEEETVAHIKPPADVYYRDGIHTLSAAGTMTVLDGKRMAPAPKLALRRLLHKFKRLARLA
jgi:hypothetical protein